MPSASHPADLAAAVALLERAIGYARAALGGVTDELLSAPTPCRGWDLAALLAHMEDSLAAMAEAAEQGEVRLEPVCPAGGREAAGGADAAVARLRTRACALLGAWTARATAGSWRRSGQAPGAGPQIGFSVAGQPLAADLLVHAGALEVAVHAWDVTRACRIDRPLPEGLASRLLELAPTLVAAADRPLRFGPVLCVLPGASAAQRLLAELGRRG